MVVQRIVLREVKACACNGKIQAPVRRVGRVDRTQERNGLKIGNASMTIVAESHGINIGRSAANPRGRPASSKKCA